VVDRRDTQQDLRADAAIALDVRALLGAWPIGTVQAVRQATSGTVNRTLLVDAASGRYALRSYRHRDMEPILREHAVIAHIRDAGLPSITPLTLPGGNTILAVDGQFHALFPFARGRQYTKAALGPDEAAAMGDCLGRLHRALSTLPQQWAALRSFATNRDSTFARMALLEAAIRVRPQRELVDREALAWLCGQREWIERHDADPDSLLAPLEWQVIHGDYQETNLFFESDRVSAVIDWDQTYLAPRAWELLRTMHYAFAFSPHLCGPFLSAYRTIAPTTPADLDRAVLAYAQKIGHDLWVHEEYYLHGNMRVERLFRTGGFVSPLDDWRELRVALRL
jgi:homoserine kinase type II